MKRRYLSILHQFFLFITVGLAVTLFPSAVHASKEFTSSLSSVYTINTQGSTHVEQTFTLKNNLSSIYITEYALEVGSNTIRNAKVESGTATLPATITPHGNKTTIHVTFPDKVVGKDQQRVFTVIYDDDSIAQKTGSVLEVHIPKLANPQDFSSYMVTINSPDAFGNPALATPATYTSSHVNGQTQVQFAHVGASEGISLIFGKRQIAQLKLTYHVQNPTTQKGDVTIALPPDTAFQRMFYTSIDPLPNEIKRDHEGNWLASFTLNPSATESITVKGDAVLSILPQPHAQYLTQKPTALDLAPTTYWQTQDPTIQELAKKLQTPQAIYDYVVKTLSYDYKRLDQSNKRFGAREALKNPTQSVCVEFTDLFIALARSAGIPAREVNGYALTHNDTLRPLSLVQDVLHAWPEYWDEQKKLWIPVDPTWENTTGGVDYFTHLDFNHITFAIHSASDTQPFAAGMYKFNGSEGKDIEVTYTDAAPSQIQSLEARLMSHPSKLTRFESPYGMLFRNTGLHAVYDELYGIRISGEDGTSKTITGGVTLLPLSNQEIQVQLPASTFFKTSNITLETQIGGKVFVETINAQSFFIRHSSTLFLILLVVGCGLITATLARSLLVPRRKR